MIVLTAALACAALCAPIVASVPAQESRPAANPPSQESRPVATAPQVAPPAAPLAARLTGAWREQGAQRPRVLGFFGARCVQSLEGSQTVFSVTYGVDHVVRVSCGFGDELRERVDLEKNGLVLTREDGAAARFERVDPTTDPEAFDSVRLDPLALGARDPDVDERADVRAELSARVERDQEVRRRMGPLMQIQPEERGVDALGALGDEMRAIDFDNTRYLTGLLGDVGWIDAERFGEDARHAAFLIVQHSPSLRLMGTVLPLLEAEARADPSTGLLYAYLYDRYQLALCGMQRYGTQLHIGSDGTHYVVLLEDPEAVDERRAEFALGPLEEYLDLFRAGSIRVVIGDMPHSPSGPRGD